MCKYPLRGARSFPRAISLVFCRHNVSLVSFFDLYVPRSTVASERSGFVQ